MNQNLSAAVERLIVDCRHPFDGGVHCLSRIDDVETILAELGRGAGDPVYQIMLKGWFSWTDTSKERYEKTMADSVGYQHRILYTRPPVAGLAELTERVAMYRTLAGHHDESGGYTNAQSAIIYRKCADEIEAIIK